MFGVFTGVTQTSDGLEIGLDGELDVFGVCLGIVVSVVPDFRTVSMPWIFVACSDAVGWSWAGSDRFSILNASCASSPAGEREVVGRLSPVGVGQ
jgi:hypothetical protein